MSYMVRKVFQGHLAFSHYPSPHLPFSSPSYPLRDSFIYSLKRSFCSLLTLKNFTGTPCFRKKFKLLSTAAGCGPGWYHQHELPTSAHMLLVTARLITSQFFCVSLRKRVPLARTFFHLLMPFHLHKFLIFLQVHALEVTSSGKAFPDLRR